MKSRTAIFELMTAKILGYFGSCPRCMRQSFVFMLAACGLAGLLTLTAGSPALRGAAQILALGSVGLWLSHLVAFSARRARNMVTMQGNTLANPAGGDAALLPRRQFMQTFARSFVAVAAATAVPGTAFARATCNCPATAPQCCYNYDGSIFICAASNANCCTNARSPWSCPSGHNCYGDSGGCS